MTTEKIDIFYCGIGGRGLMFLKELVDSALTGKAVYIGGGEIPGLAHRHGSTSAFTRISYKEIYSPSLIYGEADFYIGLDMVEGARKKNLRFSSPDKTVMLVDCVNTPTMSALLGNDEPRDSMELECILRNYTNGYHSIPASNIALKEFGNIVYASSIVFGALISLNEYYKKLALDKERAVDVIMALSKGVDENLNALYIGYNYAQKRKNAHL